MKMTNSTDNVRSEPRPFPWVCLQCGKEAVRDAVIAYTTSVKHRGKLHTVEISEFRILQCELCAALVFNDEADEQISRALRKKLGLLQPEEIRRMRIACDWSQRNLADAMHAARATVCRWEKGILIQSKRSDEALRACLA